MTLRSDTLPSFEKKIIDIMIDERCTMRQALANVFSLHGIDENNVFDLVDFLEEQLYDLDKVQAMMMIYTGQTSDFRLMRLTDNGKDKRSDKG